MTRRDVLKGLVALCGAAEAWGGQTGVTLLVVARTRERGSDLCIVRNGMEAVRVPITVIDPEIMNDIEAAEAIREGFKPWDGDDMPLIVSKEEAYGAALKGNNFLATLIARGQASLSPGVFQWATDKAAHLAPRQVYASNTEPFNPRGVLLHRLHLALEDYWRAPERGSLVMRVRRNLLAVKVAMESPGTPANWREVHCFADILVKANEWGRLG